MKIGFPTNPRKDIYSEIEWIINNNFDFIDLFMEPDLNDIEKIDPNRLRKYLKNTDLELVGHTAWYLPIGSPIKELRNAAINVINKHIVFFDSIGCNKMTVHANWPSGMFSAKEGIEFQNDSLHQIVNYSKDYGVKIMLEPIETKYDSIENIYQLLQDNSDLYFHLDIGHANLHKRNPIDFINKFQNQLLHIHLHDNNGLEDLHLPLGTGNVKWKQIIALLKTFYTQTITLEIFSSNKDYVLLSKEMLLNELNAD